jgi:hypothetical protein
MVIADRSAWGGLLYPTLFCEIASASTAHGGQSSEIAKVVGALRNSRDACRRIPGPGGARNYVTNEHQPGALEMRFCFAILLTMAASLALGTRPSEAQYAAQLYPYCAMSSSSGATSCYYRSRAECGGSCISNPWYIGARRASPYLHGDRALEPHYVRP